MDSHPSVTVVGLGPAGLKWTASAGVEALRKARKVFVRTQQHPAVAELSDRGISFESFDCLYESAEDFEDLYVKMAEIVLSEAGGGVVYAVPGHPLIGERSVEILLRKASEIGVLVEILPSSSFIEATLEALRISLDRGLKVIDALQIEHLTPSTDTPTIVYQVHDQATASRVKLRLMEFFSDEWRVVLVRGAGTENAVALEMPLYELDRQAFDHLTSVYVPIQVES